MSRLAVIVKETHARLRERREVFFFSVVVPAEDVFYQCVSKGVLPPYFTTINYTTLLCSSLKVVVDTSRDGCDSYPIKSDMIEKGAPCKLLS